MSGYWSGDWKTVTQSITVGATGKESTVCLILPTQYCLISSKNRSTSSHNKIFLDSLHAKLVFIFLFSLTTCNTMPFLEMEISDLNQVSPNTIMMSAASFEQCADAGKSKKAVELAPKFTEKVNLSQQPRRPSLKKNSSYPVRDHDFSLNSTSDEESDSDTENHRNTPCRRVSFGSVEIREHSLTLGDHPDCSYGPPTSLDWEFDQNPSVDLDQYEKARSPRRTLRQMVLNYHIRMHLLQAAGHSKEELKYASKQVGKAKASRSTTRTFLQFGKVEEAVQSAKRKLKRAVGKKNDTKDPPPSKYQVAADSPTKQ